MIFHDIKNIQSLVNTCDVLTSYKNGEHVLVKFTGQYAGKNRVVFPKSGSETRCAPKSKLFLGSNQQVSEGDYETVDLKCFSDALKHAYNAGVVVNLIMYISKGIKYKILTKHVKGLCLYAMSSAGRPFGSAIEEINYLKGLDVDSEDLLDKIKKGFQKIQNINNRMNTMAFGCEGWILQCSRVNFQMSKYDWKEFFRIRKITKSRS